jgi:hypothetical protein
MGWKGEDWKLLAENSGQWQALVNAIMTVRVPKSRKYLDLTLVTKFSTELFQRDSLLRSKFLG